MHKYNLWYVKNSNLFLSQTWNVLNVITEKLNTWLGQSASSDFSDLKIFLGVSGWTQRYTGEGGVEIFLRKVSEHNLGLEILRPISCPAGQMRQDKTM